MKTAVFSAKFGQWTTVFEILERKPYLINCIPEGRTWAILHQAVWWNDLSIVKRLLNIPNCDVKVKTKPNSEYEDSLSPGEVAEQMGGRDAIITELEKHENEVWKKRFPDDLPRSVSYQRGEEILDRLPLFMMAVINYRKTLLNPETISPKDHLVGLMKQIMQQEDVLWTKVKEQLYLTLYGVDRTVADDIREAGSEEELFEQIVRFYTGNQYPLIKNAVTRDFGEIERPIRAEDLSLALYDLMLDCVLMYWSDLKACSETTYRGVSKKLDYQIGFRVMFTHFMSSSLEEAVAARFSGEHGTILVFDNSVESPHRPKSIEHLSAYPDEKECLYALGAEFQVHSIEDHQTGFKPRKVYLKLLPK